MSDAVIQVIFSPSGRRGTFQSGVNVVTAARRLGVDIACLCGGNAVCGRCQVHLVEGEFAKYAVTSSQAHLSPLTRREAALREQGLLHRSARLSCQTRLLGDVVLDVPDSSQQFQSVICKHSTVQALQINPAIHVLPLELEPADFAVSDAERLLSQCERDFDLPELHIHIDALRQLGTALRQSRKLSVVILNQRQIIAIWPGSHDALYGVALDIGSTTLAAQLCDLKSGTVLASAGAMNPQIRYGDDVMSRLSYLMQNPDGQTELTDAVRRAVGDLILVLSHNAGLDAQQILDISVVGNPTMHHLFFGLDPRALGVTPFALVTREALSMCAESLRLPVNSAAQIYGLPCIAGHVGSDAAAVVLAERPDLQSSMMLIIDIGTNAEIILGNQLRLLACSCPTGPAFEGAQLSAGQRAATGAIERVRIDRQTLAPRVKVIGCPSWSDDERFGDTAITGICGSGMIEIIAELFMSGVIRPDGKIDGARHGKHPRLVLQGRTWSYLVWQTPGQNPLYITQNDVRAIQLAKAALYASTMLLMQQLDIQRVDQIRLAGAFGSYIDVYYAMVLGLIPDCALAKVSAAGNAAGSGARIALLDRHARSTIEQLVQRIEKIETALATDFQEHFVAAMPFPHASHTFPSLSPLHPNEEPL